MTAARLALTLSAALAIALSAAGCGTVGNGRLVRLDAAEARTLMVPGTTSQDYVRQALGDGQVIRFRSGMQTWHYIYREGLAKGWDDVPYIGLITRRLDRPTKELVILFDAAGVLRRWSLQSYRNREPPPGQDDGQ
jgi:outer membrane protein assembly factor BamE (lipoprotein component of BamABCDE complex)